MLYLLYGPNHLPIDNFIDNLLATQPQAKRHTFDKFSDLTPVEQAILQDDSLFGEQSLVVLKQFPKTKLKRLQEIAALKGEVNIVLYYVGDQLALAPIASWVKQYGGVVREFRGFSSRAIFKLLDAVSARNLNSAVVSIWRMREQKESALLALAFLFTRVEKLIVARQDPTSRLHARAKNFSFAKLMSWQDDLLTLEQRIKSESQDPWDQLENWLITALT